MIPLLGIALLLFPFTKLVSWRIVRFWNSLTLKVFKVKVEIEFEDDASQLDQGGVLVGLNQISLLDPTTAYASWNNRVLSIWNFEYALIPFFGWISLTLGWIIIRQKPGQAKRQLQKAAAYAANGGLVFLSAEGTRSADGTLSDYKKGPFVLAIQSQAAIHPIFMVGSRNCLSFGDWKIKPGTIKVRILKSISTKGLTYEDRNELLNKVRKLGEKEQEKWKHINVSGNDF